MDSSSDCDARATIQAMESFSIVVAAVLIAHRDAVWQPMIQHEIDAGVDAAIDVVVVRDFATFVDAVYYFHAYCRVSLALVLHQSVLRVDVFVPGSRIGTMIVVASARGSVRLLCRQMMNWRTPWLMPPFEVVEVWNSSPDSCVVPTV